MDDAMRIEMALEKKRFEENGAEVQALLAAYSQRARWIEELRPKGKPKKENE